MNIHRRVIGIGIIIVAAILIVSLIHLKQAKTDSSCVVINVLDPDVYNDCHIKGSINVPFGMLEAYVSQLARDTEIVVYCSNALCSASHAACNKLRELGFQKVWVYEGGMAEWYQHSMPVEGSCTQSYLTNVVSIQRTSTQECHVLTMQELAKKLGY